MLCLGFSHSTPVIVAKLALLVVVVWYLPPIGSFVSSKQTSAWHVVYKLIDDNKFVSYCTHELFVIA